MHDEGWWRGYSRRITGDDATDARPSFNIAAIVASPISGWHGEHGLICALKNVFALFCSLVLHSGASFHAWHPSVVTCRSAFFAVEFCTEEQKRVIRLH